MDRPGVLERGLREATLELCWRQWTAAGLAGTREDSRTLIDPEALLVASLTLGRYDARLFDEVLDWLAGNWRLLDSARLKRIARGASPGERALLGAVRQVVFTDKTTAKLPDTPTHDAQHPGVASAPPQNLFFSQNAGDIGWTETDPVFEAAGFLRPPVRLRGLSGRPGPTNPACLRFRLRALAGMGSKAEVLAYLVTHEWAHGRLIADRAAYPQGPVAAYLVSLSEAGLVERREEGKKTLYRLQADLRGAFASRPSFVDWIRIWPALTGLLEAMRSTPTIEDAWWLGLAQTLAQNRTALRAEGFEVEISDLRGWGRQGPEVLEREVARVTTRVGELLG
jgi:DNA-binding transcriptional ArsR family regulator